MRSELRKGAGEEPAQSLPSLNVIDILTPSCSLSYTILIPLQDRTLSLGTVCVCVCVGEAMYVLGKEIDGRMSVIRYYNK